MGRLLHTHEDQGGVDEQSLWYVGVILILMGAIGKNLGNNIVSLAHSRLHAIEYEEIQRQTMVKKMERKERAKLAEDAKETGGGDADEEEKIKLSSSSSDDVELSLATTNEEDRYSYGDDGASDGTTKNGSFIDRHLWGIGSTVFVTSSIVCFASFGFAAQSLLSSLESVQFLSNIAFAKFVHKEEITPAMILSTFLIIAGNSLVVIFSGHNTLLLDGIQVFDLYAKNTAFHIYLAVGGSFGLFCEYTWKYYQHSRRKLRVRLWNHSFVEPLCFCAASAIVGAFATCNAKNISMLLNSSAASSSDRSELKHEQLYIILIGWIVVVGFWVGRIDQGLNMFPPLFVIPVIQVCFVFFSILCGGIFFKEFNAFDTKQYIGFCIGVVLILVGVYGLAPDSELDFTGDDIEDDDEASETASTTDAHLARDRARTLSYNDWVEADGTIASAASSQASSQHQMYVPPTPTNSNSPLTTTQGHCPQMPARRRTSTMSHPLAALKELTGATISAADQTPALAPVMRVARRASALIALPISQDQGDAAAAGGAGGVAGSPGTSPIAYSYSSREESASAPIHQ